MLDKLQIIYIKTISIMLRICTNKLNSTIFQIVIVFDERKRS